MRFGLTTKQYCRRQKAKRDKKAEWHRTFAWFPRKTIVGDWVWLETIEQRWPPAKWHDGKVILSSWERRPVTFKEVNR